jgi:hypothetical protein
MAINAGVGVLMVAAGKPRALLLYNVAFLVTYSAGVLVASSYGLTAVCATVSGVYVVMLLVSHYFLLDRLLGIPMRRLGHDVAPALLSSVALFGVAAPVARLLSDVGFPAALTVVLAGALGAAAYAGTLRSLFPAAWEDFLLVARRVLRRSGAREQAEATLPRPRPALR